MSGSYSFFVPFSLICNQIEDIRQYLDNCPEYERNPFSKDVVVTEDLS